MRFEHFCARVGLQLEPFQRRIAKAAAGPERECVVLLPRGQGKTTLLAAIALHHLVTVEGAAVYCAASSREQARILFEAAAGFARALDHPNIVVRHLELRYCPDPDEPKVFTRHLRVLAADAPRLHGLTPSLAIIDELHAHATDDVYLAMRTAMLKRPGSKLIVISTAGQGADTPARPTPRPRPRAARRSPAGARSPTRAGRACACSSGHSTRTPTSTTRATSRRRTPPPGSASSGCASSAQAVPDLAFRRFHANQWTEREGTGCRPAPGSAASASPSSPPARTSGSASTSAASARRRAVVWVNEQPARRRARSTTATRACSTASTRCASSPPATGCASSCSTRGDSARPRRSSSASASRCVAFPQTDVRMIPACDRLYRAIVEKRLTLPDHPELRAHAAAAIAKHSPPRLAHRQDRPRRQHRRDHRARAWRSSAPSTKPEPVELLGWV